MGGNLWGYTYYLIVTKKTLFTKSSRGGGEGHLCHIHIPHEMLSIAIPADVFK